MEIWQAWQKNAIWKWRPQFGFYIRDLIPIYYDANFSGSISIQEGSPPSHGSPSKHTQNKAANDPSKEDRGMQ